jgi:hypothetical protein
MNFSMRMKAGPQSKEILHSLRPLRGDKTFFNRAIWDKHGFPLMEIARLNP